MYISASKSYSLGPFQLLILALGIYSPSYFPSLIPIYLLFSILFISLFCCYKKYYLCFSFLIGMSYGGLYAHWLVEQQWPLEFNNQKWLINGVVSSLPQRVESIQRFHINITHIESDNVDFDTDILKTFHNKKISLSWRDNGKEFNKAQTVKAGDVWQLEVKLKRPRGFVNPAGFDYQLYLLQQGINAIGYVRNSKKNKKLGNVCHVMKIHCWREHLRYKISEKMEKSQYLGFILGLSIGDKQAISTLHWDVLKNTGTIHLLAISGLHIGLAALIGLAFGQGVMKLYHLITRTVFNTYSRCLPSFFSIVFAFSYSCLAGLSVPTQRAFIMVVLFHLFRLFYFSTSPWQLLCMALVIVGIFDPLSIRSHGFYFSFLAVAILLFAFTQYQNEKSNIEFRFLSSFKSGALHLLKAQIVITLALFIPSILLVQGVSLSSPIANLIAVPLMSFVTVPLLLVALIFLPMLPSLSHGVFLLAEKSVQFLLLYLDWAQNNIGRFWYFDFGALNIISLIIAVIAVFYLLLPRGFPAKYLSIFCFLPIFFPEVTKPALTLLFLEVGQGTAVVIETARHQLVYDTGKRFSERFDSGQHVIAPYLFQSGHSDIDMLMTSHGDSDHAGGMSGLLSLIKIQKHYSGEPKKTGGHQCVAGQQWQWDGVSFVVLWPTQYFLDKPSSQLNANNRSCVLMVEYGANRFLLAGDINGIVERQLLGLYPTLLNEVTAVLIPHHGSRSSSHQGWVDHLQASHAIVTAGYTNAYRHPHPSVVERYQKQGARMSHTGQHGAIRIVVEEGNHAIDLLRWREYKKHYWYD